MPFRALDAHAPPCLSAPGTAPGSEASLSPRTVATSPAAHISLRPSQRELRSPKPAPAPLETSDTASLGRQMPPAPPSSPAAHAPSWHETSTAGLARRLDGLSLAAARCAPLCSVHLPTLMVLLFCVIITLLADPVSAARAVHNFNLKNEGQMRVQHNTQYFRTGQYIIVRRGGEMAFQVVLDGPLDEGQSLSLYIAPASIFLPSTLRITHLGGTQYEVSSQVDPNAPTGLCSISVRLSDMNDLYSLPRQVAVLFNPWHPQDSTFYPATDELVEYINNEQGITYRGTNVNVQSVRWYYAQFSPEAILAALHQVNKLGIDERRDPNAVIRFFTAAMTPQPSNPDGILVGRWDRTYPGGMNPSAWQGSDQVLRHYVATGFNSVKYGQCWVFAGVLNTLGRVMGIPTRQISNFDSAHETPVAPGVYNQEILRYWDRNSRRMVAEVGMIWNFHSWNEVWHDNRVAGSPYTGAQWNVVDGTPQELSGDRYQLGPASVRAVRDSQKLPFDTSFVLSEVSSRIHNFAVACPFIPWGKLNQLPPQCTIIRDMGREARYPTGTIVVTKLPGLQNFGPNTITGTYHGRGGPAANAGPVFSSGVPTPGLPTGMRARPGAPGASRFRRFSVTDGDDDDDSTEADADTEGSSGSVAGRTSRNSYAATGTGAVGRALDAEWNSLLFNYDESGLAISVTIPPVRLGEPIKLWVNFACAGRTEDFLASMRSRDRARGFITLADGDDNEDDSSADDTSAGDEDNGSDVSGVQCPDELDVSVHVDVTFTDYTGQERGRIGEHRLDLTLHPKNGYFESFEFEAADYLSGARASRTGAADEYVRVTAMAVDSSTVPGESITLVAVNTMALTMPRLTLHGNQTVLRTEQRRDKVTVDVEADDGTLVRAVVVETLSGPGTGVGAGLSGTLEREVDVMSVEVSPTGSLSFSTLAADVDADADSVATDARAGANAATLATAAAAADRAAVTDALLALADAAATADPLAAADPGVEVTVMFRNELGIALTGVVLRLSADDMGFDERVVELQSVPAGSSIIYVHAFSAERAAAGPHYYHAVLLTNELPPIIGELPFVVDAHAYVHERRGDLKLQRV